jgi:hypothetical protein
MIKERRKLCKNELFLMPKLRPYDADVGELLIDEYEDTVEYVIEVLGGRYIQNFNRKHNEREINIWTTRLW